METQKQPFSPGLRAKIKIFTKLNMVFYSRQELNDYVLRLKSLLAQAYEQGECNFELHNQVVTLLDIAALNYKIPTEA